MTNIKMTSPGYNRNTVDSRNSLSELSWCGKINLRGNPENTQFCKKAESILGMALPLVSGTCNQTNSRTVYWTGPDEWLVHCDLLDTENLIADLQKAMTGIHSAVVDVSDYFAILNLDGPDASVLINKACPLDLHPNEFKKGDARQTRFGHASILLHKLSDTPSYNIQVRWSYVEYVWDYLVAGMSTIRSDN